jgi:hypothetical protein
MVSTALGKETRKEIGGARRAQREVAPIGAAGRIAKWN